MSEKPVVCPKSRVSTRAQWMTFNGRFFDNYRAMYSPKERRRLRRKAIRNGTFVPRRFSPVLGVDRLTYRCPDGGGIAEVEMAVEWVPQGWLPDWARETRSR